MRLRVKVTEVPEKTPFRYEGELSFSEMPRLTAVAGEQQALLYFSFELLREGRQISVNGNQQCILSLTCDRCLKKFSFEQSEFLQMMFRPASEQTTLGTEVVLSREDLDIDYYQGEWLDLREVLEEQSLLGLPMRNLCSETCKGRCAGCGADLNEQVCCCPPSDWSNHPFAGLSRLSKD